MNHIKNSVLACLLVCSLGMSVAQNLDSLITEAEEKRIEYITATFKGTRVINGHSIESPSKGVLQLMFSHRFGPLDDPAYTFFGLNQASFRFGLDYGLTQRLAVGIGRSSGLGGGSPPPTYDGYLKCKILRQAKGNRVVPISLSLVLAASYNTDKLFKRNDGSSYGYIDRLYYTTQILIARKFGNRLSVQLMPTFIHRNFTFTPDQHNNLYVMGFAARVKITKRMAITGEYYASFPNSLGTGFYNPLAIGFEIETGGHVFQIHATNSQGLIESQFIGQTTNNFFDGATAIRLGFNFSRVFTIVRYND